MESLPLTPVFERSLIPMLIADDDRRYVDANAAACLLLRLPREEVLRRRVDDLSGEAQKRAGGLASQAQHVIEERRPEIELESRELDARLLGGLEHVETALVERTVVLERDWPPLLP